MGTQSTKWLVVIMVFSFQVIFSQSKGIRYQYAYLNNVVAPNLLSNNSSTFEIGNGDVMVYTPYFNLSSQPNMGYCALSRFGPDLCYKGSKLIPYPSYVSNLFSSVISKNDGGFAINTNTKPYLIRNYDSDANLIFEMEIFDENNYSTTNVTLPPKMFSHPITNNLFFTYLEYSNETNGNIIGFAGSPIINIVEISNTTGEVVSSFSLKIPYNKKNDMLSIPAISTWSFDSEISDMKFVKGNTSSKDRIWFTLNLKHQGSYLLSGNNITSNQVTGLYPSQVYTGIFSIAPDTITDPSNLSIIGLLPSSSLPKIIESGPSNFNSGYSDMMLFTVENQKPIIYKFLSVGFIDTLPSARYEFPITINNNYGDIKRHQNTILLSFDNYFGTFYETTLQLNLRRRISGFPVFSNLGSINYHKTNTSSLYLNYNMFTNSGNPTNFLIKESLVDFPNTCFSTNLYTIVATSQVVAQNYDCAIVGNFEPLNDIRTKQNSSFSYSEVTNNNIMTVFLQCNVGPCAPPQNKIGTIENQNSIITIAPNPTNNYFEVTGDVIIERVEIYSMLGQLVKTFEKQDQYFVTDMAKGSYIVKITATESQINKTLIIE